MTCASLQTRASCLLSPSFPASLRPGPLARVDLECLPSLGSAPGSGCQPHLPVSTAPGQHGARPSLGSMPPSGCMVLLGTKVKDGVGARLGPRREGATHLQGPRHPGPAAKQGRGEGPSRPGRNQQLPVYLVNWSTIKALRSLRTNSSCLFMHLSRTVFLRGSQSPGRFVATPRSLTFSAFLWSLGAHPAPSPIDSFTSRT